MVPIPGKTVFHVQCKCIGPANLKHLTKSTKMFGNGGRGGGEGGGCLVWMIRKKTIDFVKLDTPFHEVLTL